ncbi:hypothetical protein L861_20780 [Litchfieldella anticariensis FP35 = DSM 16096]|uniref:Uncharacterized protein n=1 Tax=Litchfieldella anticariensis (strain DSM 16096 / CECT 5854 / CIP 108499 / LMG 22089 / FP35) TaxID=1121939 RepID=S2KMG0_LITA3|nr:insulinase family protein [Halomonas anticariensis]EPC01663.1 hypothetical protein L861_20780 [Halomonas anticariensis FP35 = DSM 16096]
MTSHRETAGLPEGSRLVEHRLDSGMRTLAIEVPTARQVRLVAAVGVGYLDEPTAWPGLAHLLEHALFLGSSRHPQPGDFATWVGERGGRYNAHTGEYVTDVHLTLPLDATEAGLGRLIDIVAHPSLARDKVAREVDVIDAEFHARLADPELHRLAASARLFQPSHPAYRCHHGHRRSLGGDDTRLHEALTAFHATHYRAECMSLVMLGPQPAEQQLTLLTTAAGSISTGAAPLPTRPWRWAPPARVQWRPPGETTSPPSTLELLWPLPDPLEPAQRQAGESLVASLCDGALAATLLRHDAILDLDARLDTNITAAALVLTLTLTPAGRRQVETLLATCQAWVADLAKRLPTPVARPTVPHDLDNWPKTLARRLALGQVAIPPATDFATDELATWLKAEHCRVLEPLSALGEAHDTAPETGTLLRCSYRTAPDVPIWPCQPASTLEQRPLASGATSSVAPGIIANDDALTLWWDGGPPLADTYLALAWPAPVTKRAARLACWRQRTLSLRQAATRLGLTLVQGSDGHDDWLLGWGDASRLESCFTQALAAWSQHVDETTEVPEQGLLAQRLLSRLDHLSPPRQPTHPRCLAWAGGMLGPANAESCCRRLIATLPAPLPKPDTTRLSLPGHIPQAPGAGWPICWVPPQADDQALMLQIDAPDDSPASQALFQLLAQCHDAAFHQELRQRQGLGYVAAVRYREGGGWPRLGYVVQSPTADITTLQQAVREFLALQGTTLAMLDPATFLQRRQALAASWGPPETHAEALTRTWQALRRQTAQLAPWQIQQDALQTLTPGMLTALAEALTTGSLTGQWWAHSPSQ